MSQVTAAGSNAIDMTLPCHIFVRESWWSQKASQLNMISLHRQFIMSAWSINNQIQRLSTCKIVLIQIRISTSIILLCLHASWFCKFDSAILDDRWYRAIVPHRRWQPSLFESFLLWKINLSPWSKFWMREFWVMQLLNRKCQWKYQRSCNWHKEIYLSTYKSFA